MDETESFSPKETVRRLMRVARTAALATLARRSGHPFGSLVTVASEFDGSPIVLLSGLAAHSRNLADDPRASLLFEDRIAGDPQTAARVTVTGRIEPIADDGSARRRYLARNPDAALYADFGDFAFHRLVMEDCHLVAGFGRAMRVKAEDVRLDVSGAGALAASEADLIAALAGDPDRVAQWAALLGGEDGPWAITGIDPEGLDLATAVTEGRSFRRLRLPGAATSVTDIQHLLSAWEETAGLQQIA